LVRRIIGIVVLPLARFTGNSLSQIITATYEEGVLKPDQTLELAPHTRVRLTVDPIEAPNEDREQAWVGLQELWDTTTVRSTDPMLSRDQLHERR
jgi:predicted DNA-binding antitoxin AbrB/MazE fold protein